MDAAVTLCGPDGRPRCRWCLATPEYVRYHDEEWGFPVADDRRLFEKLCLEGFQSGLSWRTVLEKRENFRAAFHGFDFVRVAAYTDDDIIRLLQNPGIIRHRGKIAAAVNNARRALELVEREGSLAAFIWKFEPQAKADGLQAADTTVPRASTSPESVALSKELKRRGWQFVGPTTVYSFMQAMGLVNDHDPGCAWHERVEEARAAFQRPG